MRPQLKIWIENEEGEQIIGEGLLRLLQEIEKTGSLNKASERLGMSYRTAWGKLEKIENRMGIELVIRRSGGGREGGSRLTERGRELMSRYLQLKRSMEEKVKKEFDEVYEDEF